MKKRVVIFSLLLLLFFMGWWYGYPQKWMDWETYETHEIRELKIPGSLAPHYVAKAEQYHVPWFYLAAIDEVETGYQKVNQQTIEIHAEKLRKKLDQQESTPQHIERVLLETYTRTEVEQMRKVADAYAWEAATLSQSYLFPFRQQDRSRVSYADSWGAARTYGGERKHEGTDLMAATGTPLVSVTNGEIVRKEWDRLGGWCLLIQDTAHPQMYYYYAHLSQYANEVDKGDKVTQGQLIGYVGSSGYGPEGTTGQFPPHLHFGIYVQESLFASRLHAVNSYPFLKTWEVNK
jgi:peptidoglycan LD-endopeptidase LytH